MTDSDNNFDYSRYITRTSPSKININKEDIFYRDKYNDILNYIKTMLTNYKDLPFQEYIKPKGTILLNTSSGTDIMDFLRLISKNYYLELIELNNFEAFKAPEEFSNNLTKIIKNLGKNEEEKRKSESEKSRESKLKDDISEKGREKSLIVINQQMYFKDLFKNNILLKNFITFQQNNDKRIDFINEDLILIWINYDIQEIINISNNLFETFDLLVKVPILNKSEREAILKDFLEKNAKLAFDVTKIVNYTENWEVNDMRQLLRVAVFKYSINSELNDQSNDITDVLTELIESGEFIPSYAQFISEKRAHLEGVEEDHIKSVKISKSESEEAEKVKEMTSIVDQIKNMEYSEFMLSQLYENAASKNYNELVLIIDKFSKNEPLEQNERKMLAKYPFILNDTPNMAQINLEKAKKRVDLMRQAFGK